MSAHQVVPDTEPVDSSVPLRVCLIPGVCCTTDPQAGIEQRIGEGYLTVIRRDAPPASSSVHLQDSSVSLGRPVLELFGEERFFLGSFQETDSILRITGRGKMDQEPNPVLQGSIQIQPRQAAQVPFSSIQNHTSDVATKHELPLFLLEILSVQNLKEESRIPRGRLPKRLGYPTGTTPFL